MLNEDITSSVDVDASAGQNFIVDPSKREITLWTFPRPDKMINGSKNTHYKRKVKIGTNFNLGEYLNSLKLSKENDK